MSAAKLKIYELNGELRTLYQVIGAEALSLYIDAAISDLRAVRDAIPSDSVNAIVSRHVVHKAIGVLSQTGLRSLVEVLESKRASGNDVDLFAFGQLCDSAIATLRSYMVESVSI